jgi:hypothetical protein
VGKVAVNLEEQNKIFIPKLQRVAHRLGGNVVAVSEERYDALHIFEAPFTSYRLGIDWIKRVVYFVWDTDGHTRLCWGDIIHEMGHVFACKKNPDNSDEYDFFGWEWALMKQIGGNEDQWNESQKHYQIGIQVNGSWFNEWGSLTPKQRRHVLKDRLEKAKALGLIDSRRKVQAIR